MIGERYICQRQRNELYHEISKNKEWLLEYETWMNKWMSKWINK